MINGYHFKIGNEEVEADLYQAHYGSLIILPSRVVSEAFLLRVLTNIRKERTRRKNLKKKEVSDAEDN